MSTAENRRPNQQRPQRPRREPLFPLEEDDIAPRRRGPPAPLGDILDDLSAAMPTKADELRRDAPRQRQQPAPPAQSHQAPVRGATENPKPQPSPTTIIDTRAAPRPQPRPILVAAPDEDLLATRLRHDETETMLHRAEMLAAQPYTSYRAPRAPQLPGINTWQIMLVVALASLLVLSTLGGSGITSLSRWGAMLSTIGAEGVANASRSALSGVARSAGDYALQSAPSVTPQQIDAILASYGSPAAGTGAAWYNLGLQYGIDPAFAVAFFIHESSAGTNAAWAGLKPGGASTHNVGNIICAGYATCYGRFRDYASWDEGIEDWYRLIDVEYIKGRGTQTVQDIIPIYAPSFENDVQAYINSVTNMVDGWRINGVH